MAPRIRLTIVWILMTLSTVTTSACAEPTPTSPAPARVGHYQFRLPGHPTIPVYYAVGRGGDSANRRVIVVMHGTNRNAEDYRDAWVPLIQDHPWVVIAPEFGRADFPGVEAYNLGGMIDEAGRPCPREDWTFAYIEPLVQDARRREEVKQPSFDMFGHSAGAQFVHRFIEFEPHAAVHTAVAANAGWYTMPDPGTDFPYGTRRGPAQVDWGAAFGRNLHILLGSDDVEDENLRTDDGATEQGPTRIARGERFHQEASRLARAHGTDLRWTVEVVPGVAHDHQQMSREAAAILAR